MRPNLKFNHVLVKRGLMNFGKLYGNMIGNPHPDMLYTQISLSLRVLLCHYRRCAVCPTTWSTCQRQFKGEEDLGPVGQLLSTLEIVEYDDEMDKPTGLAVADWKALQHVAPKFWQVHLHILGGCHSISLRGFLSPFCDILLQQRGPEIC